MEVQKLDICPVKNPNKLVKVKEMGNITEVTYMEHMNTKQTIQMLPGLNDNGKKEFVDLSSGEVKECNSYDSRLDNIKGLRKTFTLARDLINTNVVDVKKVRWITLTYAPNMTDTKKLYCDFSSFNKRFKRFCLKHNFSIPEYIVMMEPQGRGAWHAHLLYIWQEDAPYIPNDDLFAIWRQGWTKIKKLDNVDNVGAYLTAYLGDMDLEEYLEDNILYGHEEIKIIEFDEDGQKVKKRYIKGARLKFYPPKFNMIRYSRGIKKPNSYFTSQPNAEKKVSSAKLTYESTFSITDSSSDFTNVINKRYYNHLRT